LRGRHLQRALDNRRPNEPTLLEPFGEQAQSGPVSSQNLHVIATLAPEHECARIRIGAQNLRDIARRGATEICLPNGARVSLDADVNAQALRRVLSALARFDASVCAAINPYIYRITDNDQ
jgi:hypothetical protein